jgi:hypothetical protein
MQPVPRDLRSERLEGMHVARHRVVGEVAPHHAIEPLSLGWKRQMLGLPRYVERDFTRYLECGVLAHGFARVPCESCQDELLVAFSCKGRGVCPTCNAKRAHVTAVHLVERVLPHVPYRQWALSFPHRTGLPGAFPAAATGLDGGGRPAPSPKTAPVRLPGGILPARQYAPACERQAGIGAAVALHRAGIFTACGVPGASASGKPHEIPRRLRSRRQTAAISGPPSRWGEGERGDWGSGQEGADEAEDAASGLGRVAQEDVRLQRVRLRLSDGAGKRLSSPAGSY